MNETRQTAQAADAAGGPKRLPRYLLLFALIFLGWSVLNPFLPAVLMLQGATLVEVGLLLGLGTALRLLAMWAPGAIADRTGTPGQVLAVALLWRGAVRALLRLGAQWRHVAAGRRGSRADNCTVAPLPDALAV